MKKHLIRLESDDGFLTQISIRHAGNDNLKDIFEVLLAAYRPYQWVMPGAAFAAYLGSLFEQDHTDSPGSFVVASRGDRVLGVAVYEPNSTGRNPSWPQRWASLRAVAVIPEARRMGIGQLLLSACAGYARAQGASVLCLHVPEFSIPFGNLSERLGLDRAPHLDCNLSLDESLQTSPRLASRAYVLALE